MKANTVTKIHLVCPVCKEPGHCIDYLEAGRSTITDCDHCGSYFKLSRRATTLAPSYEIEVLKEKKQRVVVTLQSTTEPPITLKVNDWMYPSPDVLFYQSLSSGVRSDTLEEFWEHKKYYYDVHCCLAPTLRNNLEEIIVDDTADPHGFFKFVSVELPKEEDQ